MLTTGIGAISTARFLAKWKAFPMADEGPNPVYGLYLSMLRRLGHYKWFGLTFKHLGTPADRALIRVSRGRLSMGGSELPTMLLTTTGRKTGKQRTVPLNYVRDGSKVIAVCENFGLDTASSWPYNLLADPKARLEIKGTAADYLARPATDEEVTRNMPKLVAMWPAHDTYLERSGTRKVFVFEPVSPPS